MRFTAETAVIAAKKSHAPDSARNAVKAAVQAVLEAPQAAKDDYTAKTLARVRVQLDLVNERLTDQLSKTVLDAQAVDRLAAAQTRLSEQERILSGRPLPGSLKPTTKRSKPESYAPQPTPAPQPQAPASSPDEPNG